jgi:hypothetical protein
MDVMRTSIRCRHITNNGKPIDDRNPGDERKSPNETKPTDNSKPIEDRKGTDDGNPKDDRRPMDDRMPTDNGRRMSDSKPRHDRTRMDDSQRTDERKPTENSRRTYKGTRMDESKPRDDRRRMESDQDSRLQRSEPRLRMSEVRRRAEEEGDKQLRDSRQRDLLDKHLVYSFILLLWYSSSIESHQIDNGRMLEVNGKNSSLVAEIPSHKAPLPNSGDKVWVFQSKDHVASETGSLSRTEYQTLSISLLRGGIEFGKIAELTIEVAMKVHCSNSQFPKFFGRSTRAR